MKSISILTICCFLLIAPIFLSLNAFAAQSLPILIDAGSDQGDSHVLELIGVNIPLIGDYDSMNDPAIKAWHDLRLKNHRGIFFFDSHPEDAIKVIRDAGGAIRLDFTGFDAVVSDMRNMFIADTMFTVAYMPKELSSSPDADGELYSAYAPRDYNEWYQVVYTIVQHIVHRFGLKGAYYEVWNEPDDAKSYWRGLPKSETGKDRLNDYLVLYAWTATAIKAADPTAKVGGPSTAHYNGTAAGFDYAWGLRDFLTAVRDFNGGVAVDKQLPLDFITWHDYAWANSKLSDGADFVKSVTTQLDFAKEAPYFVTEWNRSSGESCGQFTRQQIASHAAYNLVRETSAQDRHFQGLYWYGLDSDNGCVDSALMSPLPSPGCHRPAFAVYEMLSAMTGGKKITTLASEPLEAFATKEVGKVMAVISNNSETLTEAAVKFNNLPWGNQTLKTRIRRMDKTHSIGCAGLEDGGIYSGETVDNSLTVKVLLPEYSAVQLILSPE